MTAGSLDQRALGPISVDLYAQEPGASGGRRLGVRDAVDRAGALVHPTADPLPPEDPS